MESNEFSDKELIPFSISEDEYRDSNESIVYSDNSDLQDNEKEIQIIRYSGSTQWDEEGESLFLSFFSLCENRNLDICVADKRASALVVAKRGR